jgi:hypothetical protein
MAVCLGKSIMLSPFQVSDPMQTGQEMACPTAVGGGLQLEPVAMWIVVARARVGCALLLLLVACGRTLVCLLCLGASGGCCNAAMSNVNVQSSQCAMCNVPHSDVRYAR